MTFSNKESELVVQLPVFANGIAADVALYQVTVPDAAACVVRSTSHRPTFLPPPMPSRRNPTEPLATLWSR